MRPRPPHRTPPPMTVLSPSLPILTRRLVPFSVRAGLRHLPANASAFPHTHCERASPLRRDTTIYEEALQRAKEHNVRLGASRIHGQVLGPGESFSWHAVVGPPIRLRGFLPGPELHDGRLSEDP